MSVLDSIVKFQRSVSMHMTPTTLVVDGHLFRKLEKEATFLSLYSSEACTRYGGRQISFVNDMEIKVSNLLEENEIMFCDEKGNFSKFLIENIDRIAKLPKRKGRYIRCNSIST